MFLYIYIYIVVGGFIYICLPLTRSFRCSKGPHRRCKEGMSGKSCNTCEDCKLCIYIYIYIYRYTFKPQSTYGLYDYISIDLSQRSSVDWWIALQEERLRWDGGVLRCHQGERFTRTGTGWRGDPKEIKGLGGQLSTYHFRAQINI